MAKIEILPGTVFGKWTVLGSVKRVSKNSKTQNGYFCECVCGRSSIIPPRRLLVKESKSCQSCARRDTGIKNRKNEPYKDMPGWVLTRIKNSADKRGLSMELTMEDLDAQWQIQGGKCALTGWEIKYSPMTNDNTVTASPDRIDSQVGYTPENLQYLHKDINRLKNNYTEDRFFEMCQAVTFYKDETKRLRGKKPWHAS